MIDNSIRFPRLKPWAMVKSVNKRNAIANGFNRWVRIF
jgi:hypothetical protein